MFCGLFYVGGGVFSGIGSLLVVVVVIVNILLCGCIGLVIVVVVSFGLFYLIFFFSLSSLDVINYYVQVGGFGILCFVVVLVIQVLVWCQEQIEMLVEECVEMVVNLEEFNVLILQCMCIGIFVVDSCQVIFFVNQVVFGLFRQDDVQGVSLGCYSLMLMYCMK